MKYKWTRIFAAFALYSLASGILLLLLPASLLTGYVLGCLLGMGYLAAVFRPWWIALPLALVFALGLLMARGLWIDWPAREPGVFNTQTLFTVLILIYHKGLSDLIPWGLKRYWSTQEPELSAGR